MRSKSKACKNRDSRDNDSVNSALDAIRIASAGDDNLFPLVIEALKENCTLGEIISAMKSEFGTYMAPSGF